MLPAGFLQPWDALEMNNQDMGEVYNSGMRLLLLITDWPSRYAFAYPLETKEAQGVAEKLLEFIFLFGVPRSLRRDPGTVF